MFCGQPRIQTLKTANSIRLSIMNRGDPLVGHVLDLTSRRAIFVQLSLFSGCGPSVGSSSVEFPWGMARQLGIPPWSFLGVWHVRWIFLRGVSPSSPTAEIGWKLYALRATKN